MKTISLCMIVKNEEDVIERCLKSVKQLVDEIIIVDTGSTDSTKSICKKFTNKIFDFKWCEDFSKARNFAFSKASCEYIMWLDADDIVPSKTINKLLKLKSDFNADTYMLRYDMGFVNNKPTFSFYRERILKNCNLAKWNGCVHECITPFGKIKYLNIAIEHHKIKTSESNRNYNIYRKILKERSLTPRELYYYGRELYDHKKYKSCINILKKFISTNECWIENLIDALYIISNCYFQLGNLHLQLEYLFKTFNYSTPRSNICCKIGDYFLNSKQYLLSKYWYEMAISNKVTANFYGFNEKIYYSYYPYLQLCVIFYHLGDYEKSYKYNNMAHKINPSDITIKNRIFLETYLEK